MAASAIYQCSPAVGTCLRQGEILSDLVRYHPMASELKLADPGPKLLVENYPFAIVISQDCDLSQDFDSRKQNALPQIPNVLFCHLPTAEELKSTPGLFSKIWDRIKINKDERYHFLEKIPSECDTCAEGLPELGVDFKRYFTLPTDEVYRRLEIGPTRRRSVLRTPYLEHLSSRFAFFLSRIALPGQHHSE